VKHFHSLSQIIHKRVLFTTAAFLFATGTLNAQSNPNSSDEARQHPDWVQVPGELIRPECVHQIPKGAKVEFGEDGNPTGDVTLKGQVIAHFDACSENAIRTRPQSTAGDSGHRPLPCETCKGSGPIPINGWVEASQWYIPLSSSDNIDLMEGEWYVPNNPSAYGGLIFLWNGIEPSNNSWVLQPVLQYGKSYAGGGNYWAIASWLVGSTSTFVSPLVTVNPGDLIYGITQMTGTSGSTLDYEVVAYDLSSGWDSWITVGVWGLQWTWAYSGVLEAYQIDTCSQLPSGFTGDTQFQYSNVFHGYPNYTNISPQGWIGDVYWGGVPGQLNCGFHVSPGNTSTLYY